MTNIFMKKVSYQVLFYILVGCKCLRQSSVLSFQKKKKKKKSLKMVRNDIFLWCPCKQNALFHKIYTPLPLKKATPSIPSVSRKGPTHVQNGFISTWRVYCRRKKIISEKFIPGFEIGYIINLTVLSRIKLHSVWN